MRRRGQDTDRRGNRPTAGTGNTSAKLPRIFPVAPQWVIAGAAFLLSAYFAIVQPVDLGGPEGRISPPDESAHLAYLEELCRTRRLPVFTSGHGNYEAHQPPLYYIATAPLYAAVKSLGRPAAARTLRLVNCAIAAVSVPLLWQLMGMVFSSATPGRWIATVIAALWPGRLIAVAAVSNDAASELAAMAALLAALRCAETRSQEGGLLLGQALLLGGLIGIAMLVKSSTLPLLVVGIMAIYVAWRCSEASQSQFLKAAAALLLGFLAVWGWWGLRNTLLYGDPLAAGVFQRVFKQDRATPEYFFSLGLSGTQYYMLVLLQTAKSFWGVLGQANVFLPRPFYWVGALWWAATFTLAAAKIALLRPHISKQPATARRRGGPSKRTAGRSSAADGTHGAGTTAPSRYEQTFIISPAWLLLATHFVLTFALFLRFNAVFYQAQARYFLPASAAIGAFMAWPWTKTRRISAVGAVWFAAMAAAVVLLHALGAVEIAGRAVQ